MGTPAMQMGDFAAIHNASYISPSKNTTKKEHISSRYVTFQVFKTFSKSPKDTPYWGSPKWQFQLQIYTIDIGVNYPNLCGNYLSQFL
jgi:hypothetical protein